MKGKTMYYEITHSDGRRERHDTLEHAMSSLAEEYSSIEAEHGEDRVLVWGCPDDAANDSGAHAVAAVVAKGEVA